VLAVSLDSGFMERNVVHNETRSGSIIQTAEQVQRFRSVDVRIMQGFDALATRSDRWEDWSSSPRPFSVHTEDTEASESESRKRYHAGIEVP